MQALVVKQEVGCPALPDKKETFLLWQMLKYQIMSPHLSPHLGLVAHLEPTTHTIPHFLVHTPHFSDQESLIT